MKPLILQSPLSDTWYISTRYTVRENGVVVASRKCDVTDQMAPILDKVAESLLPAILRHDIRHWAVHELGRFQLKVQRLRYFLQAEPDNQSLKDDLHRASERETALQALIATLTPATGAAAPTTTVSQG